VCLDRPRDPLPTSVDRCPPLPAEYHDSLDRALGSLGLILDPSVRQAIDGHVRLLVAWNAAINLTSVRDPAQIAIRHVSDSLTAVRPLQEAGIDALLDLGSGGGFPGLPLAATLSGVEALLVDSVGKKARFLEIAVNAIGLASRVRVGAVRAEALAADHRHRERWPAVIVRAVAPLAELVELAFPLLVPGGLLVAWKSADAEGEQAAARRAIDALGGGSIEIRRTGVHDAVLGALAGHCLVLVRRGDRAVAAVYPRDPAVRRRQPW
jgi:16S rRNA (guanine527-N7)-methyltransferase